MNSNSDNSGLEKANKFLQQGQIQEAITEYRRCIKSIPSQSWSHYYLGDVLTQLEDWEGAAEAYRQTIALGENYLCYYHLGVALVKLERWDEAIEVLNRGLELNPGDYQFYFLLGPALVQKKDWQVAINAYRQAVTLKPTEPKFNLPLGQLLLQEGIFQEAISYLEWAVDFNSEDPQLQLGLGMALVEVGFALNKAENCLNKSLELQPNQPRGYFYLGQLFRQRGRLHEALGFYRRSWELKQELDCGFAVVAVLEKLGRWLEVVEQYRQILFEFGESGEVLFGLGRALITLGRPAEAVVELRRAMGQGWKNPKLYECLAKAFLGLHRYDEAILEWERFLAMQPGNTVMRKRLALTLMGLGRWPAASLHWQRYLQVAPGGSQGALIDFRPMLAKYGEFPHSQELSIKGDLTVEFWLYLRQWPKSWTNIIGKLINDQQNEFCLRLKNGEEGQWYYGNGDKCVNPLRWVPQEKIQLNQWVHIACVRKVGEYGQLYINGILQGERGWKEHLAVIQTEVPVRLMVSCELNEFLDGMLSDVRVWQVARTGEDIKQAMYEGITETKTGLIAVWHASGDGDLVDAVGTGHGTMKQVLDTRKPCPRVGIVALNLSNNLAGRVYDLVQLYESFASVELIDCAFSQQEGQGWETIAGLNIPWHTMQIDDEEKFVEQMVAWVLTHPYEVVHLSNATIPNIILGLLYKVLWHARVFFDISEENVSSEQIGKTLNLEALLGNGVGLPRLIDLLSGDWTNIARNLAKEFDGLTVENIALQERYGGVIIRPIRDEKQFVSPTNIKHQIREQFAIAEDKRVILFFVTTGEYKSLFSTAEALASLECKDVVLAIIGNFPDSHLKEKLLAISDLEYLFVEDESFESVLDIMVMGDICVLSQDITTEVSQLQIPPNLWDALEIGMVVILSETPAITDLIEAKVVVSVGELDITEVLDWVLSNPAECEQFGVRAQEFLKTECGLEINKSRLEQTVYETYNCNQIGVLSNELNMLLASLPAVPNCLQNLND